DLEGLTQEQAAQRLGCPSGTVRSRLARGRGLLRARLLRKGLAPSTGALAALLAAECAAAPGPVPAALVETTTRAAASTASGRPLAGAAPAALWQGVVRAMLMIRLQWTCVGLLTIGLGVGASRTAVIALAQAGGPPAQEKVEPAPSAPTAPKAPEA